MLFVLKSFVRIAFDSFLKGFVIPRRQVVNKTLLILRLDAIGDYVLFRNFIKVVANDDKYSSYTITLAGNEVWRSLAEKFDTNFIGSFIWIDRKKFSQNLYYRSQILKKLTRIGYEVAICPSYSRDFSWSDSIMNVVQASEKIGSVGDLTNVKKWQKKYGDKYYTRLIYSKKEMLLNFL